MKFTCYECGDNAIAYGLLVKFKGDYAAGSEHKNHQLDIGCFLKLRARDVIEKVVHRRKLETNKLLRPVYMMDLIMQEEEAKEEATEETPETEETTE